MNSLLQNWKACENNLAERRKYLTERGMTADQAIAETLIKQKQNNKSYESAWNKGQYRRIVAGIV